MSTVRELLPGDLVTSGTERAVFIKSCPHPIYHHLWLVVWRMAGGQIHLDSLHPDDEAGDVEPIEPGARAARLEEALSS